MSFMYEAARVFHLPHVDRQRAFEAAVRAVLAKVEEETGEPAPAANVPLRLVRERLDRDPIFREAHDVIVRMREEVFGY